MKLFFPVFYYNTSNESFRCENYSQICCTPLKYNESCSIRNQTAGIKSRNHAFCNHRVNLIIQTGIATLSAGLSFRSLIRIFRTFVVNSVRNHRSLSPPSAYAIEYHQKQSASGFIIVRFQFFLVTFKPSGIRILVDHKNTHS